MTASSAPTAPTFEDLLNLPNEQEHEEIIEGLTENERQELMEEQFRIMAQIENETRVNTQKIANAQADAFDQRSANAVAQVVDETTRTVVNVGGGQHVAIHGQEKTRAAIANGTAILANCVHCQTRVQVTHTATLLRCPVCAILGRVERQSAEEEMDRRIAEQLQSELYADGEEEEEEEEEEKQETWLDSMASAFTSSVSANHVATGNATEQTIAFSNSFEERKGLLLSAGSARVAERQPIFSCVLDSVASVADALTTLPQDEEGKVHGVDSNLLLASESDTPYLAMGSPTSIIKT